MTEHVRLCRDFVRDRLDKSSSQECLFRLWSRRHQDPETDQFTDLKVGIELVPHAPKISTLPIQPWDRWQWRNISNLYFCYRLKIINLARYFLHFFNKCVLKIFVAR